MKSFLNKIIKRLIKPQVIEVLREDYSYSVLKRLSEGYEVCDKSKIGKSVMLYPPYRITNCEVGDYTYVAQNSQISFTQIGKFCSLGPNLVCGWGIHPLDGVSTSPMFYSTKRQNGASLTDSDKFIERKPIYIGNDVFIGANVTILDGVTVGDGAVIGAGAVVSKDIPPYAIAVGCPIVIKRYRFEEELITRLKKIEWWNFDEEELKKVEKNFFEVDVFVELFKKKVEKI